MTQTATVEKNGEGIYLLAVHSLPFPTDPSLFYEKFIPLNIQAVALSVATRETIPYALCHRTSYKSGNGKRGQRLWELVSGKSNA